MILGPLQWIPTLIANSVCKVRPLTNLLPMDLEPPLSRDEAEDAILAFEDQVRLHLRQFSPESFAVEIARRYRVAQFDKQAMSYTPFHFLVHALEANCAYYQQWKYRPLMPQDFNDAINLWHNFRDPAFEDTIRDDPHFFRFQQYLHRTQLEMQVSESHIRFGRAVRLYGGEAAFPKATEAFKQRYRVSPREWMKLVFIFLAKLSQRRNEQRKHPHNRVQDLSVLQQLGLSDDTLKAFLRETSRSWQEIGDEYRQIRKNGKSDRQNGPLTWGQRRPALAKHPIMAMAHGLLVPVPPLLVRLLGDGLFERFDAIDTAEVRKDIGDQFERYVGELIRHHLPGHRLLNGRALQQHNGRQSCDFALELPNAILLIECKAVMLDRVLVTQSAVMNSSAINRTLDGFVQVVRTAEHIKNNGYPEHRFPLDKPILGIVVTLGHVPGADNELVQAAMMKRFEKEGFTPEAVLSLCHRPQPFDAEAMEYLVLMLQRDPTSAPVIFADKLAANPMLVGDWSRYLNERVQAHKPVDLTFWRQPTMDLLGEMKLDYGSTVAAAQ